MQNILWNIKQGVGGVLNSYKSAARDQENEIADPTEPSGVKAKITVTKSGDKSIVEAFIEGNGLVIFWVIVIICVTLILTLSLLINSGVLHG